MEKDRLQQMKNQFLVFVLLVLLLLLLLVVVVVVEISGS